MGEYEESRVYVVGLEQVGATSFIEVGRLTEALGP